MNMRKIISLTAFLSFFLTFLTSIILYIIPQGRVAYWADWRLWTLSKEQWGAMHINLGFLFLVSLLFHIYYNWKPILSYLKNKTKQITIFTKEFNLALILTALFIFGTYIEIPPFSTIIEISDGFKASAIKKYGEPPYGHAELSSIKTFSQKMNINLGKAISSLKNAGYNVDNDNQTLKDIAKENGVSPQRLYNVMSDAIKKTQRSDKYSALPDIPAHEVRDLVLADFCSHYNLNIKVIIKLLNESNIIAKPNMTIKEIGKNNHVRPMDIYEKIKSIVDRK